MAISTRELKRRGVSDEDIELAKVTQEAQRRQGCRVHTLGEIVSGKEAPSAAPALNHFPEGDKVALPRSRL